MRFTRLLYLAAWLLLLPTAGHAAFPVIAAEAADTADTDGTSTVVSMPASISAGNLLMVHCSHDSSTILAQSGGSDWTRIWSDTCNGGTACSAAVFAKIAAGGDALTVAGAAQDTACNARRITGHGVTNVSVDILLGTAAKGTSTTPNPPNVAHGGPQDYRVITHVSSDDDDNSGTPCPTNYTLANQTESAQSTSSVMVDVCARAINGTSEDPGTGALAASEEWVAQTFSIPPSPGTEYTKYTDDFNRADENPLSNGGTWDGGYTSGVNLQVVGNDIRPASLGSDAVMSINSAGLTDAQWCAATISSFTGTDAGTARILLRAAAPATVTYYIFTALINEGTGHRSRIEKFVSGTYTELKNETVTNWAATDQIKGYSIGTRHTIQRKVSGGSFVSVLTAVDTSITSGRPGALIFIGNTTGVVSDVQMDDVTCGDYTAPAGGVVPMRALMGVGL